MIDFFKKPLLDFPVKTKTLFFLLIFLKTKRFTIFTGCFAQFSTRIYSDRILAASDLFLLFTQSVNFYTFYCLILKNTRCVKNVIRQNRNKWLLLSTFQYGLGKI